MADTSRQGGLVRTRRPGRHFQVTFVELFFDLVFVFAITQLSHALLAHFTPLGVVQTILLLMAVWWVWVYTLWVTNWLDPRKTAVRLMLYVLMLAGLIVSTSIPQAFGERGLAFAGAYVFMQVGRSLFMVWAVRRHSAANFRNFQRITAWLAVAGLFWIAGGLAEGDLRLGLWIAALALEYLSPAAGFWTPGLGRSTTADWDVEGAHMAERCGLFMIIALGESIIVTGATFAGQPWSPPVVAAFTAAFIGTVAMWWVYFNVGAERASRDIAVSADPGRVARLSFTYIHVLIVAGVIVAAVANEFVLAHPTGHADLRTVATALAGPGLFLIGNILFKCSLSGRPPLSHLVGLVLLGAMAPLAGALSPLLLGAATTAVLVLVAVWETVSLRGDPPAAAPLEP